MEYNIWQKVKFSYNKRKLRGEIRRLGNQWYVYAGWQYYAIDDVLILE